MKIVAPHSKPIMRWPPRHRLASNHNGTVLPGVSLKHGKLLGLCAVLALGVWAAPAAAAPLPGPQICPSEGTAISGNYRNLTITGNAYVASSTTLNVRGDLTLARGACLDAFTLGTVKVRGNVLVGKKAILALGCSPGSIGPGPPCEEKTTSDTVGRNILADQPLTMYLDGDTIHGNVISIGGGPGVTMSPYVNFPIKENVIDGDLFIAGWQGTWFGILRNTVHGSVIAANNVMADPDATEIVTNTISGNLVCFGNSPAPQFGDAPGAMPNNVYGHKIGQCTAV
jgi:hypothetical protein